MMACYQLGGKPLSEVIPFPSLSISFMCHIPMTYIILSWHIQDHHSYINTISLTNEVNIKWSKYMISIWYPCTSDYIDIFSDHLNVKHILIYINISITSYFSLLGPPASWGIITLLYYFLRIKCIKLISILNKGFKYMRCLSAPYGQHHCYRF